MKFFVTVFVLLLATSVQSSTVFQADDSGRGSPPSTIVFDLDSTLLRTTDHEYSMVISQKYRMNFPNSMEISYSLKNSSRNFPHFVAPYTEYLLRYLIEKTNYRVWFFSAGTENRNASVIPVMLMKIFGGAWYQELLEKDQFKIFSNHHLVNGKKSLKAIGLDPDRSILVDDNPDYALKEEGPFIHIESVDLESMAFFRNTSDTFFNFESPESRSMHWSLYILGVLQEVYEKSNHGHESIRLTLRSLFESVTKDTFGRCNSQLFMLIPEGSVSREFQFLRSSIMRGLSCSREIHTSVQLIQKFPSPH